MPTIYNTWLCRFDKLDFDFVMKQVGKARELGLEYFVIDAGWFGEKGNWVGVTRHKPDVRRWASSLNRISPPPGF